MTVKGNTWVVVGYSLDNPKDVTIYGIAVKRVVAESMMIAYRQISSPRTKFELVPYEVKLNWRLK